MKKCTIQALKSKEIQGIFGKTLFWHYYLQLSFIYKTVSQISFTFPQISWLKIKFQKTETRFCIWKSTANNHINIFLSLENRCTFLLAEEKTWKRIFNTNSELSQQNCTEKQIVPSKTAINCLFHYILRYLFIACFHWKIDVFQQTVVRVYYIHHIPPHFKFMSYTVQASALQKKPLHERREKLEMAENCKNQIALKNGDIRLS